MRGGWRLPLLQLLRLLRVSLLQLLRLLLVSLLHLLRFHVIRLLFRQLLMFLVLLLLKFLPILLLLCLQLVLLLLVFLILFCVSCVWRGRAFHSRQISRMDHWPGCIALRARSRLSSPNHTAILKRAGLRCGGDCWRRERTSKGHDALSGCSQVRMAFHVASPYSPR